MFRGGKEIWNFFARHKEGGQYAFYKIKYVQILFDAYFTYIILRYMWGIRTI